MTEAIEEAPFPGQIFVDVESSEEDVVLVKFTHNGNEYRGALLKVKPWQCPSIPKVFEQPQNPAEVPVEPQSIPATDRSETLVDSSQVNGIKTETETEEKPDSANASTGFPDFVALQHRWSYFVKNAPVLPKKNFPSKREKDRLDQVPKLRPRNFLCTRCRCALPGFTRAATSNANGNAPYRSLLQSGNHVDASFTDDPTSSSTSHLRKGKIPLKRAAVNRIYDFPNSEWPEASANSLEELSEPKPKKEKSNRRKKPEVSLEPLTEPPPLATVLSSDNGLKMKIKLTPTSPVPNAAKERPKREPKPKMEAQNSTASSISMTASSGRDEDDDDDDDRPRLMIDDSTAGEPVGPGAQSSLSSPSAGGSHFGGGIVGAMAEGSGNRMTDSQPAQKKRRNNRVPMTNAKQASTAAAKKEARPTPPPKAEGPPPDPLSDTLPKPVARAVQSCVTKDGRTFSVGDIIWGKLTGYPWWPGKINHIVVCDDPMLERTASTQTMTDPRSRPMLQYQEAQVEWFGKKSSFSYIEVLQLSNFVEDYNKRHKPKMRGDYAEAVRLAAEAVQQLNSGESGQDEEHEKDIFSELAELERNRMAAESQVDTATRPQAFSTSHPNRNVVPGLSVSDVYDFGAQDAPGNSMSGSSSQTVRNQNYSSRS